MSVQNAGPATATGSCQSRDWVGTWRGWAIWGSAAAGGILGSWLAPASPWPMCAAFLIAGAGCVANAARCGRRHCYFTGPAFLFAAAYIGLTGFHLVPMSQVVLGLVVGVAVAGCLSEHVLGRYASGG